VTPKSPAAESHPPVLTFKRRAGRVTATQRAALEAWWSTYGLPVDGRPLDPAAVFGRSAPLVLEIGFGMGEATAALAAAEPDHDVLAVDVHTPGQGHLLTLLDAGALTNVRVMDGDATVVLGEMLGTASLSAVRVFFPDPWPKTRHVKRRLVDLAFAELVADRLVDGGLLHVATDVPAYAEQVRAVLARTPLLQPVDAPPRPTTRFERRAVAADRPSVDLAARRVCSAVDTRCGRIQDGDSGCDDGRGGPTMGS
jgi:tRNA (guanine-N7-)-methyltransferase